MISHSVAITQNVISHSVAITQHDKHSVAILESCDDKINVSNRSHLRVHVCLALIVMSSFTRITVTCILGDKRGHINNENTNYIGAHYNSSQLSLNILVCAVGR